MDTDRTAGLKPGNYNMSRTKTLATLWNNKIKVLSVQESDTPSKMLTLFDIKSILIGRIANTMPSSSSAG